MSIISSRTVTTAARQPDLPHRYAVHFRLVSGQAVTLDLRWTTPRLWREKPEEFKAEWRTIRLGPRLLALKLTE